METWIKAVLFLSGVTIFLIVILVPLGFHGVEYYEYGFVKSTTTRKVDTSKVYGMGHHSIGITKGFKTFQADAHLIALKRVEVFTSNRLAVNIDCSFQYFLRRDDLKLLHDTYDLQYEEILQNNAIDALKGATKDFATEDFGRNRSDIESAMFKAVRLRLGGICCKRNCEDSSEGCEIGCLDYSQCTIEDKGLFADVKYFQMGYVDIPENVRERNLKTLTQREDGDREVHLQTAQLARVETDRIVAEIENQAEEIAQNATAQSALILSRAEADSRAILEQSHNEGLSKLFNDLNMTSQDQKASLNYIRTLRDHRNVYLGVNFDSLAIRVYGNTGGVPGG
ncbi:uncharacterized protein [Amphiura filiformis]|uniref:uncharacterized protein isoform X1 n=1 Tax=Amphiura filiformis TaxID=82378 RepID=UPI003B21EF13